MVRTDVLSLHNLEPVRSIRNKEAGVEGSRAIVGIDNETVGTGAEKVAMEKKNSIDVLGIVDSHLTKLKKKFFL